MLAAPSSCGDARAWMAREIRDARLALAAVAMLRSALFWFLTIPATVAGQRARRRTRPISPTAKTMFYAGGCASCHATPKQDDKTKLGGGLRCIRRSGPSTSPNISSDPKDGIGAWTEAQFVTAMLKGTSPDG